MDISLIADDIKNNNKYVVEPINKSFVFSDNKIYILLEQCIKTLTELNQIFSKNQFSNLYINMLTNIEGICSSEIEGTKTDIKELLSIEKNNNKEIIKVHNLITTAFEFFQKVKNKEIDICSIETYERINAMLFQNVLPEKKYAGKVRTYPIYVGGKTKMDALYIPPSEELLPELLKDINDFWKNEELYIPTIIKIAIFHFQFETIHPFFDGNGRIGRLLINLQLQDKELLDYPILCLSNYWKKNRKLYYEALDNARYSGNFEHWIRFFLVSVIESCKERIDALHKISDLTKKYYDLIEKNFKNTKNLVFILEHIIQYKPYISIKETQEMLGLTYQGAHKLIDGLVSLNILQKFDNKKRHQYFYCKEYVDLVNNLMDAY